MTYKKLIIIIIFFLALGGGVWVYKSNSSNKSYKTYNSNRTDKTNTSYKSYTSNESYNSVTTSTIESESKVYNNADHNFSLQLLPGLSATSFEEGEGDVVLIGQDRTYRTDKTNTTNSPARQSLGDGGSYQMQITIRSFDEDTTLTAARIQTEVPEIKMQNPINVKADGVEAVSFIDQSDSTRQIWFVQNRELFQIIALAQYDNITGKLMEGWQWQ